MIRISLAGVNREDVEITFSDSVLSVSGERRSELDEEEVSFYVRERYYGTFRRSMALLAGIDESSAPTSRTVCWRSPRSGRRRRGGSGALAHRDQEQIRRRRLT